MQMQTSSVPQLTAAKLAELVALGHNRISQIYLHWTAGRYGQLYDDYHFNIDADGSIYQTCTQLTELKSHTWQRNTGAIGIALCCACGALPHNGRDTEFGKFPPTPRQIDAAGKLVAKDLSTRLVRSKSQINWASERNWPEASPLRLARSALSAKNGASRQIFEPPPVGTSGGGGPS